MLIEDHTKKLHVHIDELVALDCISEAEAENFRARVDALGDDLNRMYERNLDE